MDFLLIALLTLLNGVFAMSELALASSRKSRLAAMAEGGDKGAQAALTLLDNPTQFLSSVQVGITSIGMINGIIGEAAFSSRLGVWLQTMVVPESAASVSVTAIVVTVINFITIGAYCKEHTCGFAQNKLLDDRMSRHDDYMRVMAHASE